MKVLATMGGTALVVIGAAIPAHAAEIFYPSSRAAGYGQYTRSTDTLFAKDTLTDGAGVHVRLSGTRPNGSQDSWEVYAAGYGNTDSTYAPLKSGTLATMRVCVKDGTDLSGCTINNFTA